jgi:site-specific recombinase XerC
MSRNYGLGSRDMGRAGATAIERHYDSYASQATNKMRWHRFVDHIREQGVRRMEHITVEHIQDYANSLKNDALSASSQQNYISAVNVVLEVARGDRDVRLDPTDIADSRTGIAERDLSITDQEHELAQDAVSDRVAALLDLQRNFGLRFEESAKLDAQTALDQARELDLIVVSSGTKGGQEREIELSNAEHQIEVLERAAQIQGGDRSMIPEEDRYVDFKRAAYREIERTDLSFHGQRHTYSQERYEQITSVPAPIKIPEREDFKSWAHYLADRLDTSVREARSIDRAARMQISKELGHHRIDVVGAYLGGR